MKSQYFLVYIDTRRPRLSIIINISGPYEGIVSVDRAISNLTEGLTLNKHQLSFRNFLTAQVGLALKQPLQIDNFTCDSQDDKRLQPGGKNLTM